MVMKQLDFVARRIHFVDHLVPVWRELPARYRGKFFVPISLLSKLAEKYPNVSFTYLEPWNDNPINIVFQSDNTLVSCAYGDMKSAYNYYSNRKFILMEHGVGLTMTGNAGYAGGIGFRKACDLFLAPNEYISKKTESVLDTPQIVVGTPKLDKYDGYFELATESIKKYGLGKIGKNSITVCLSFHWNGSHVMPEAGNAFEFCKGVIPELAKKYNIIGHGHPKDQHIFKEYFDSIGVEFVEDFEDVMKRADIYVNDASSTMYEFLVTGKPVILLNPPHYRKMVSHGIRFWDYVDIGISVNRPSDLDKSIEGTINDPLRHYKQRLKAVTELYPNIGISSKIASDGLVKFLESDMSADLMKPKEYVELKNLLSGKNRSTKGISNVEVQHLCWLGSNVPLETNVVEIGSHQGKSACCIGIGMRLARVFESGSKIFCVDLWRKGSGKTFDHYTTDETYKSFLSQIDRMELTDFIRPVEMDSIEASKAYAKNDGRAPVGLLFIDANHRDGHPKEDATAWMDLICPGGRIAFHDYEDRFPDVQKAVEMVKESGEFEDYKLVHRIWSARKVDHAKSVE